VEPGLRLSRELIVELAEELWPLVLFQARQRLVDVIGSRA
jgi:hypothetical protein